MARPWLHVTINRSRGIALVKGHNVKAACRSVGAEPAWSRGSKGWVIDAALVPDLMALAQHEGQWIVVRELLLVTADEAS